MKWKISKTAAANVNFLDYRVDWDKKAPSKIAQHVQDFLKVHCKNYLVLSELRIPKSLMRIDYLVPEKNLAIEVNGKGSHEWNPFFMKSRAGFLASIKRDMKKQEQIELNGFTYIVITDENLPLTKEFFSSVHDIWL